MATNKTTKTEKPSDWIRDFRTKYAGTCNRAVMARRAERAREYNARTASPDRATVRRIMAGKCPVIFPADAKPAKTLDTVTLKKLCVSAERLKFSNGPSAKFWELVAPDGKHVVTLSFPHRPNLAFWGDKVTRPDFPWDFAHNGGVNVRALVSCQMADGTRQDLLCDFDQPEFDALP